MARKRIQIDEDILIEMQADYLSGNYDIPELSNKYNLNVAMIRELIRKGDWCNSRCVANQVVKKEVEKKIKKVVVPTLIENEEEITDLIVSHAKLNKQHYSIYGAIGAEMEEIIKNKCQTFEKLGNDGVYHKIQSPLELKDYKLIVDIVEKVQNGQRLACGLDKKNEDKDPIANTNNFNFFSAEAINELRSAMFATTENSLKQIQSMVENNLSE